MSSEEDTLITYVSTFYPKTWIVVIVVRLLQGRWNLSAARLMTQRIHFLGSFGHKVIQKTCPGESKYGGCWNVLARRGDNSSQDSIHEKI